MARVTIDGVDKEGAQHLTPPGLGELDPNIGLTGGVTVAPKDLRDGPCRGVAL